MAVNFYSWEWRFDRRVHATVHGQSSCQARTRALFVTMTMQPSSSASGTGLLASLRVQAQVNGGPQKKANLEIYQGGLAIGWSIGLFGQKASSNPDAIIIRGSDLILAQVSGQRPNTQAPRLSQG